MLNQGVPSVQRDLFYDQNAAIVLRLLDDCLLDMLCAQEAHQGSCLQISCKKINLLGKSFLGHLEVQP
jgi:hypothetical protein